MTARTQDAPLQEEEKVQMDENSESQSTIDESNESHNTIDESSESHCTMDENSESHSSLQMPSFGPKLINSWCVSAVECLLVMVKLQK